MTNTYSYIFNGKNHTDTSAEYFAVLGMTAEQIDAVLNQKAFELSQNTSKRKIAYNEESDPLFMEAQFEATPESLQKWKDKVNEIKLRYPIKVGS